MIADTRPEIEKFADVSGSFQDFMSLLQFMGYEPKYAYNSVCRYFGIDSDKLRKERERNMAMETGETVEHYLLTWTN